MVRSLVGQHQPQACAVGIESVGMVRRVQATMSYRPITDVWILGRPKVRYHGAYPSGFLERARALLGVSIDETVLHVCSGQIRYYPFRGLGRHDLTVDIDQDL